MVLVLVAAVAAAALSALSCGDPVHDAAVTALGPEKPGVSPGPTHRPGQPCLTCHGGLGPASVTFVTAGTVYTNAYGVADGGPLDKGAVNLVDSTGSTYAAVTNDAGNFYVTSDQWNAVFPLGAHPSDAGGDAGPEDISVAPAPGSSNTTPMHTAIDRGGVYASCAYCHVDPPGPTTPGHVHQN
jgi:hypothetical protein